MKRFILSLVFLVSASVAASAFSYDEAREEAYFLTDKMAYELNLTSEQYNRVYQVNLDYLLSVSAGRDRMADYLDYRDADLRYILADWQFSLYRTLAYFCRPVVWRPSGWHFVVYDHYRRGYLYFGRPAVFVSYRGQPWIRRRPNETSPYRYVPRGRGRGMRDFYFDDRDRRPGGVPHSDRHGGPGATRLQRPGGQVGPGATTGRDGYRSDGRPGGTERPGVRPGNDRPADGGTVRPSTGRGGATGGIRGAGGTGRGSGLAGGGSAGRTPSSGRAGGNRPSSGRGR